MTDLDWMHDILFEAKGVSLPEQEVSSVLYSLPSWLKLSIDDWGMNDTEVREAIYEFLTTNC